MAWEDRNGHQYYYFKQRKGKRVTSMYLGAGQLAEVGARLIELEARRRERVRRNRAIVKGAIKAIEIPIDDFGDLVQRLLQAHLLITGHHTHRGQWRRIRNG